jgi:hypothetical protein
MNVRSAMASAGLGVAPPNGLGADPAISPPITPNPGPASDGGCPDDPLIWRLLKSGSPRLAYARALGVPFAPLMNSVRAVFSATSTTDVPNVSAQDPYSQDTLIDCVMARVQNESSTANQSNLQSMADFFFGINGALEATLIIGGAPSYNICPRFTPISTIADMFVGDSHWPNGWILSRTQQPIMSFHATVTPLPYAPFEVIVSFRGWVPRGDMYLTGDSSNSQAIANLRSLGYMVSKEYEDYVCR